MASGARVAPSRTIGGGIVTRSLRVPLPLDPRIGPADQGRSPSLTR